MSFSSPDDTLRKEVNQAILQSTVRSIPISFPPPTKLEKMNPYGNLHNSMLKQPTSLVMEEDESEDILEDMDLDVPHMISLEKTRPSTASVKIPNLCKPSNK